MLRLELYRRPDLKRRIYRSWAFVDLDLDVAVNVNVNVNVNGGGDRTC
jgi:hypothetical protein